MSGICARSAAYCAQERGSGKVEAKLYAVPWVHAGMLRPAPAGVGPTCGPPNTSGKLTVAMVPGASYGWGRAWGSVALLLWPLGALLQRIDLHPFAMSTPSYVRSLVGCKDSETVMMDSGNEPVEISMHFSPEDWTEASLAALVGSYQAKLQAMGAPPQEILTHVDKQEDGSVDVNVSWDRRGTVMHTMTGRDAAGRLVPHGNKPGLIMYTEENGETYLEVPEKQSFDAPVPAVPSDSIVEPDPVERTDRTESTIDRQDGSAVPWVWFAAIGAGVLAGVGCIGWFWRKGRDHRVSKKAESRDAH